MTRDDPEEDRYDEDAGERKYLPPGHFTSLRGVAVTTCVLLLVGLIPAAFRVFLDFMLIGIIEDSLAGREVLQRDIDLHDRLSVILAVVHVLIALATAIAFLTWLYRAYSNVPALGAGDTKHSPGWAVGAFFVPILNLFRPYQIVREAWDAGEPYVEGDEIGRIVKPGGHALIGWWWASWIVFNFVGQIVFRAGLAAKTPQELLISAQIGIASEAITLVCTILALLVVRRLTDRQEARDRALLEAEERWDAEEAGGHVLPPADGPDRERIRAERNRRGGETDIQALEDEAGPR
jgi:hypothetical protein